jgi:hypothetical protein
MQQEIESKAENLLSSATTTSTSTTWCTSSHTAHTTHSTHHLHHSTHIHAAKVRHTATAASAWSTASHAHTAHHSANVHATQIWHSAGASTTGGTAASAPSHGLESLLHGVHLLLIILSTHSALSFLHILHTALEFLGHATHDFLLGEQFLDFADAGAAAFCNARHARGLIDEEFAVRV